MRLRDLLSGADSMGAVRLWGTRQPSRYPILAFKPRRVRVSPFIKWGVVDIVLLLIGVWAAYVCVIWLIQSVVSPQVYPWQ